jgi:site-specific DNA-cytosine methylase
MKAGSLFSGCGALDAGLEDAGFSIRWQVENDHQCNMILSRHWPDVRRHGDITSLDPGVLDPVDLVAGGDPCPRRSRASSIHGTDTPDLWTDFLRVVSALRPLWVLREHVVAGDTDQCYTDLCRLGYDAIVLECDSAEVTGQSWPREYLCGVLESAGICPGRVFSESPRLRRDSHKAPEASIVGACLTTSARRYDSTDDYVLEPGRGTRILCPEERERLQGLQPGWTAGLSDTARERLTGNAATRPVIAWIGRCIMETRSHEP